MGLSLFIVMLAVPLSFAANLTFPFTNCMASNNTGIYNVTTWLQQNNIALYFNIDGIDQSKVYNPVSTNHINVTHTGFSSLSCYYSTFETINNNTWIGTNETPASTRNITISTNSMACWQTAATSSFVLNQNLYGLYDQVYRLGEVNGIFRNGRLTGGGFGFFYGSGRYSSSGYPVMSLVLNDTNFYTAKVTILNPSKHVYFDFESGTYTQCNDTSCYFDEADMHWGREYNIVNDMPVGSDGMIPDSSDTHALNDLNAISCSSYGGFYHKYADYYSTVECIDYPAQCNYYIYCFNQSTGHGDNQFYGVVKFLNATDANLTFYYALYSGSENLEIAGFDYYPVPVVSSNNLTTYWHTGVASDTRLFYRNRHVNGSWSSWLNVYNSANVTSHTIDIGSSKLYAGYEYQVYAYSVAGNATGQSDIYQFNVTGVSPVTTTTTTTTLPYGSDTANAGMIQSVSYSDRYPAIDQTIRIDIYITNNGTHAGNYSVGLSIGNVTSGVWCNRDCYDDGLGAYGHTGKVEVGSTVMVTRYYKFRHEFFLPSRNYSIAVGVYPYDYAVTNFDYDIFSNAITTKSIAEIAGGGKVAYPISVSVVPAMTRRGGEVKVISYVFNNGSVPYTFKLGMSLGIWDKNESVIYNATQPALIHPCNLECYTDDLGDWVNIEIPPNYTAPFTRTFTIPDYFLENTSYDVAVGVYIGDVLVAIRYFDDKGFVQTGASSGQPQEILEPTGAMLGALLGITTSSGVLLIILIMVMAVGVYAAYKTKHAEIGVLVMVLMIIAFFMAGKIPLWIMILIVVVASAIAARMFGNVFGGGGS
jgi:hypothetical protein